MGSFVDIFLGFFSQKETTNRRFLRQLDKIAYDFLIGQVNQDFQVDNRANTEGESLASSTSSHLIPVNGSQVDIQILETSIIDRDRSEVENAVTTVETSEHDAVLAAMDSTEIFTVELALKSVNASSGRGPSSVLLDSGWRGSSQNIEGLPMNTSSRLDSNTELSRNDETRDKITLKASELSVSGKNFTRQSHIHHISTITIFCQQ